jgi:hypothetical protein
MCGKKPASAVEYGQIKLTPTPQFLTYKAEI